MYKIEKLHSIFDCQVCKQILEDPIILPCGETICRKDLEILKIDEFMNKTR